MHFCCALYCFSDQKEPNIPFPLYTPLFNTALNHAYSIKLTCGSHAHDNIQLPRNHAYYRGELDPHLYFCKSCGYHSSFVGPELARKDTKEIPSHSCLAILKTICSMLKLLYASLHFMYKQKCAELLLC